MTSTNDSVSYSAGQFNDQWNRQRDTVITVSSEDSVKPLPLSADESLPSIEALPTTVMTIEDRVYTVTFPNSSAFAQETTTPILVNTNHRNSA
jgi:hypothetical protein